MRRWGRWGRIRRQDGITRTEVAVDERPDLRSVATHQLRTIGQLHIHRRRWLIVTRHRDCAIGIHHLHESLLAINRHLTRGQPLYCIARDAALILAIRHIHER